MKILVLCADYPDLNGGISLNYVHTRNIAYQHKWGVDVTVLNFKTQFNYVKDEIKVISLQHFKKNLGEHYDILVCHAANLKNHYAFLKKYDKLFSRIVFFYHGHEVMKITKEYPKEYGYKKRNILFNAFVPLYDFIKLRTWRKYILSNITKVNLVFVSEWMYDVFLKNTGINKSQIEGKSSIIYNSVSKNYETLRYDTNFPKEYDYITIRGNIDTSKFAIDLVNKFAFANPTKKFLIVGRGEYFDHYKKSANIERIEKFLDQNEIVELLNKSRCALMPTRCDAQGVMACEMATFGIPLITSDIFVCRAVLKGFPNVGLISNSSDGSDLIEITSRISPCIENVNNRFFENETVGKEVQLFKELLKR